MADNDTPPTVTVTDAELNAIREKIRMEERGKLQTKLDQLETAQQKISELSDQLLALQTQSTGSTAKVTELEASLAQATQEFDALKTSVSGEDNTVDVAALIREVNDTADQRFAGEYRDRLAAMETRLQASETHAASLAVDNYRQARIAEERGKGTKFIAELVTGSNKEDIEKSILGAVEVYKVNFPATIDTATTPSPQSVHATAQPGAAPVTAAADGGAAHAEPSAPGAQEGIAEIATKLTGKRGSKLYEENRDALLEAATAEHAGLAGAGPGI